MKQEHIQIYRAVLAALRESGPRPLMRRLKLEAEDIGESIEESQFLTHLQTVGPNDSIRKVLSLNIYKWDDASEWEEWTADTPCRTLARRELIYQKLDLGEDLRRVFNSLIPVVSDDNVIIADDFEPWYIGFRRREGAFYWPAYEGYLGEKPGWEPESIANLDYATSSVVERLADPTQSEVYQSKGLVVGYVQSGKTANITGVIAKAIDAGYRLIVVMTGTMNLLRQQTQRRIDMELVGIENILRDVDQDDPDVMSHVDYQDDPDWPHKFVSHKGLGKISAQADIIRLTNYEGDYKSLKAGISALEFEKREVNLPLYEEVNLQYCSARLVVVKKNKQVLTKLVRDLKRIKSRLSQTPALIIDDESDHASVNTSNPNRWSRGQKQRTAINGLISELLDLLPRAQYVGYTATPFANVFIDPSDSEDIFPKDFLICLARPPGYMGVKDFHDINLNGDLEDENNTYSRRRAHVRNLTADKDDYDGRMLELRDALDMFVLSGAIKLYREDCGYPQFRHHTMLAHESVQRIQHRLLAEEIRHAWNEAEFNSPSSFARLRELYVNDVEPTSSLMEHADLPRSFEELKPFIGSAVAKCSGHGDPVIIVNGDSDVNANRLDFDRDSVWRVLVGGAKLSRGFTIEGLTVSYYRRKTYQTDTLMQMGRWFGFRKGYRDLVRLYIGRQEHAGRGTVDLYEAFEAVMRDEEEFRGELTKYAELVDGRPQIKPAQVPPLVSQRVPWLLPTARNKMFNARLVTRRSPGSPVEPTAYPKLGSDIEANYSAMMPLMRSANLETQFLVPGSQVGGTYDCRYGIASHSEFLSSIRRLKWLYPDCFRADLAFFEECMGEGNEWVVMMPQLQREKLSLPELGERSVFVRTRRRDPLFQAISDPKHRQTALRIAGSIGSYGDRIADELHSPSRGAVLIYPVLEKQVDSGDGSVEIERRNCIVSFTAVAPANSVPSGEALVQFEAHNRELAELAIVPDLQE